MDNNNVTDHELLQEIQALREENRKLNLSFQKEIEEYKSNFEEALQQSSRKWEAVIDASPDGIGITSLDGKIQHISDKLVAMHGYDLEEKPKYIGSSIFDFVHPSSHQLLIQNLQNLLQGETNHKINEYVAIKKDRTQFYIDVNARILYDSNGVPTTILYVERDITERKRVEKEILQKNLQLAELNATKDKFFSIIAHDLKSPFQGLLGYTQILLDDHMILSEEEKITFIKSIEDLSLSAFKLLENLLEWSRIQTGQMSFVQEEFNLLLELYPTLSLVKQTAQNKGIEFSFIIGSTIAVFADKNMLSTIIRNLVSNSIKYTEPGGRIVLKTKKLNSFIEISVEDTGIGMEEETIKNLFKIGKSTTRKGTANEKGTGLGLLLCKEMVERHGGIINVESKFNKGSKFIFTIPESN